MEQPGALVRPLTKYEIDGFSLVGLTEDEWKRPTSAVDEPFGSSRNPNVRQVVAHKRAHGEDRRLVGFLQVFRVPRSDGRPDLQAKRSSSVSCSGGDKRGSRGSGGDSSDQRHSDSFLEPT